MKTIQIPMPDDIDLVLGTNDQGVTDLVRLLLAIKLYEDGHLTSGQAAEIACVSRRQFLLETAKHGVPAVEWDAEELAAEAVKLG